MLEIEKVKKQISICGWIVSVLFIFSIAQGFLQAIHDVGSVKKIISQSFSAFAGIRNLKTGMIFLFIFLNNAIKGFFAIISGTVFGISSAFFIFFNGQLVGFVFGLASVNGIGFGRIFAGIAPHGILEIPAMILSATYGVWLGYRFLLFILRKGEFKIYFSYALKKYLTVILPLFFLAAIIETFVTPIVIGLVK